MLSQINDFPYNFYLGLLSDFDTEFLSSEQKRQKCAQNRLIILKHIEQNKSKAKDAFLKGIELIPKRQKYVLQKRFIEHQTLRKLGNDMSISYERVRQLQQQGLNNLHNSVYYPLYLYLAGFKSNS